MSAYLMFAVRLVQRFLKIYQITVQCIDTPHPPRRCAASAPSPARGEGFVPAARY